MSFQEILINIMNTGLPEKTRIVTDQGIIPIQNINIECHTIDNKKIIALIHTPLHNKFLVCFQKHSLSRNYPNGNTLMTGENRIEFRGMFIKSCKFVGLFPNVTYVLYNGEVIYNIIISEHSKIIVNNLVCETIHPNNPIAKLYNTPFCNETKNKPIEGHCDDDYHNLDK
jgi:hypothetical protein